jgi:hypothetical protein
LCKKTKNILKTKIMAKTISFTGKNVKTFSAWLKKFASIEKSLLIDLDEMSQCFSAKSYNDEKSIVKSAKITFADAGFTVKTPSGEASPIQVGIYDVTRIIKSLDHFSSGEFSFDIKYNEVLEGQDKKLAAEAILMKSTSLKMKIGCSSLQVFNYISEELFTDRIAATDVITLFDLPNVTIERINSLCDLDKEYKFLEFIVKDKKVFVKGQVFELDVADDGEKKGMISIYKDQFAKVDDESYSVKLGSDKLVFTSKDTDTTTVLSMVVKDTKYDEEDTKF